MHLGGKDNSAKDASLAFGELGSKPILWRVDVVVLEAKHYRSYQLLCENLREMPFGTVTSESKKYFRARKTPGRGLRGRSTVLACEIRGLPSCLMFRQHATISSSVNLALLICPSLRRERGNPQGHVRRIVKTRYFAGMLRWVKIVSPLPPILSRDLLTQRDSQSRMALVKLVSLENTYACE
jgi:hypothetical protein